MAQNGLFWSPKWVVLDVQKGVLLDHFWTTFGHIFDPYLDPFWTLLETLRNPSF